MGKCMPRHKNNIVPTSALYHNLSCSKQNMQVGAKRDTFENKELLKYLFQYSVKCQYFKPIHGRTLDLELMRQHCHEEQNIEKYQQIYFKAHLYKTILTIFSLIF